MTAAFLPVLLAGGNGTRLWPLSRTLMPKQFIRLAGTDTMLQQTLCRLDGLSLEKPFIICNEEHRFIVAEQARQAGVETQGILLEPFGRNTAPAVAMVAFEQLTQGNDPLMLVLPSDHRIENVKAFQASVIEAAAAAGQGKLVTFGIVPSHAETGYGYIEAGQPFSASGARAVKRFVEKPDKATAEEFLANGHFFWNSGMFLFRASRYLEELKAARADIYDVCEQAAQNIEREFDFARIPKDIFEACPDESIDYAVMEPTAEAAMVPLDAGWSDLGSWSALWEVEEKDADNNVKIGDVVAADTRGAYIRAESRLVATIGLEDVVVVETKDAVLVAEKSRVQDVKRLVEQIRGEKRTEHHCHVQVFRPWGDYESIDDGARFQVKRITVKPGQKLSLQMHYHRAEHWIVVKGTALVECGDETTLLTENQSTFIPVGTKHRLINPGKVALELIEVQSGSYLGEDDIVRFDDNYGRS